MINGFPSVVDDMDDGVLTDSPPEPRIAGIVEQWLNLKGRPSRPIDKVVVPRDKKDFERVRAKLSSEFFAPFDRVLSICGFAELSVRPTLEAMAQWNKPGYSTELVHAISSALTSRPHPRLIPYLVELFMNLENEARPMNDEWLGINAIIVPGSRTYDRAAEAYRAYRRSAGHAQIVCSGRAPYYDQDNADYAVTESEANFAYLRMLGVPDERIITETRSMDTTENAEFLSNVFQELINTQSRRIRVLLVTSPFHIARFRLNVETLIEEQRHDVELRAIGSRASRYWAETYFIDDPKSGYRREETLGVVLNEYLKVAFDICAQARPQAIKAEAERDAPDVY